MLNGFIFVYNPMSCFGNYATLSCHFLSQSVFLWTIICLSKNENTENCHLRLHRNSINRFIASRKFEETS